MEHSIAVRRKHAMVHNGAIVCRQSRCVIVHWLIVNLSLFITHLVGQIVSGVQVTNNSTPCGSVRVRGTSTG